MVAFGPLLFTVFLSRSCVSAREPVPQIIPYPKTVRFSGRDWVLKHPHVYGLGSAAQRIAATFADDFKRIYGTSLPVDNHLSKGAIVFRLTRPGKQESYHISTDHGITATAPSAAGLNNAASTLLQLLKPRGVDLNVPSLQVDDAPDRPFRGLLLDVARRYHSIGVLKQSVLLCHLYKINYLQLHLSDDQAFTFPSKRFPKIDQFNQHGGPSYTLAELAELVAFADAHGVTIIPEMDIPGHSATLIRAQPDLFKIKGTQPYEHHASINFAKPEVVAAVDTLVNEMIDVFRSSPYFHMGGDEADIALADQNSDFQKQFKALGLPPHSQQELFRRFIGQVDQIVKKRGKKLIVWEGFGRDPNSQFPIPKDVTVMEFENAYYLPDDLLKDGYTVINSTWTPLYVVNRHVWSADKVFSWDLSRFGRFSNLYPMTEWLTTKHIDRIIGAEACSWEGPEEIAIDNLRRLVPAMAERVWDVDRPMGYAAFAYRLSATDQVLEALIHPVRLVSTRLDARDPNGYDVPCFTHPISVSLSSRSLGTIRYTVDGTAPTGASPAYVNPIPIVQTTTVRTSLFDDSGQRQGFENSKAFYYVPPHMPNLATHKKVTVSGGTQGPQTPDLVVDDNLDLASSWWAAPAPQWLQVDLAKEFSVNRIEVFPYWDGHRYYQYTVEASLDGKHWTMVADRSQNSTPASSQGDEIKFPAQKMRFVRVNMLRGSANEGVHLVELRVWEAK